MTVSRRTFIATVVGSSFAGLAGGAVFMGHRLESASADAVQVETVLFDPDNPVLGNPQGSVTIVEYFDYQCPFCKIGHSMLTDLVDQDGDIRLVMKDWPIFGSASVLASQLALGAASLGQYDAAHSALMATPARLTEPQVRQVLQDGGIDTEAALAAYRDERGKWDGLLSRNAAQAAALALGGTPAFIIGEELHAGALDAAALRAAVSRARKPA